MLISDVERLINVLQQVHLALFEMDLCNGVQNVEILVRVVKEANGKPFKVIS